MTQVALIGLASYCLILLGYTIRAYKEVHKEKERSAKDKFIGFVLAYLGILFRLPYVVLRDWLTEKGYLR